MDMKKSDDNKQLAIMVELADWKSCPFEAFRQKQVPGWNGSDFFRRPRPRVGSDGLWYTEQAIGINTLGPMLKRISASAETSTSVERYIRQGRKRECIMAKMSNHLTEALAGHTPSIERTCGNGSAEIMLLPAWIRAPLAAPLLLLSLCGPCSNYPFKDIAMQQLKTACGASGAGEQLKAWEFFDEELARALSLAMHKGWEFSACKVATGGRQLELLAGLQNRAHLRLFAPGAVSTRTGRCSQGLLDESCRRSLEEQQPGASTVLTRCRTTDENELEAVKEVGDVLQCSTAKRFVGSFRLTASCEALP
uniref:Uncharacterized protein n=1 Tax=Macrostomum lignano TaxID=282301 RepID=A0A1I8IC34_9PLAT